jgi:4-hydroxy-3-polyprenylbenzoate decarboxylase
MKMQQVNRQRLIVAISGASGFIYGYRLLQLLQGTDIDVHLILSRAANHHGRGNRSQAVSGHCIGGTGSQERGHRRLRCQRLLQITGHGDCTCSMKTLAEIANGIGSTLISRCRRDAQGAPPPGADGKRDAADTHPPQKHAGRDGNGRHRHPPVPAFYTRPANLDEMVDHSLGRVLDLFDIEVNTVKRWQGLSAIRREVS